METLEAEVASLMEALEAKEEIKEHETFEEEFIKQQISQTKAVLQ